MYMSGTLMYNKPINKDKHNLNFGGFGMKINNQDILFDLDKYTGSINTINPRIIHFEASYLDSDVTRYVGENDGNKKLQEEMENWNKISVTDIFEFHADFESVNENEDSPQMLRIIELNLWNNQAECSINQIVLDAAKFCD